MSASATTPRPGGRSSKPYRLRGLNWREIGVIYRKEMRAALRERSILVNSILLPIFLYPFILWAAFTGLMFVQGQTERLVSRVSVLAWPKEPPTLRRTMERAESVEWLDAAAARELEVAKVRDGRLDAFVEFLQKPSTNRTIAACVQVQVTFNESKERSATARTRVVEAVERFRSDWLKREGRVRGISPAMWQGFALATENVASGRQMGAFLMGLMLPVLFVVMVAVGCFYPAVDATAGERERHTWETLMSTPATRGSIVIAKYLYVTSLGGVAGLLNLAAMGLTLRPILGPVLAGAGGAVDFRLSLSALPFMALAAVLLAAFVSAGMMVFAAFARTFKEGQAMITPFYLLVLLPALFLQVPGIQFTAALACVPVVNLTLMVRAALSGGLTGIPVAVTVTVSLGLILAWLWLADTVLRSEEVLSGSYRGGLLKFCRDLLVPGGRTKRRPVRTSP